MEAGWKVDVAGSEAIVRRTAVAGATMQDATTDVDGALQDVVEALADTDASRAAAAFSGARQGEATAAVGEVQRAITAATGAMNAFAAADAGMADDTETAVAQASGRSLG